MDQGQKYFLSEEFLKPLEYLNPYFHMSPFDNRALEENLDILKSQTMKPEKFETYYGKNSHYLLTYNAREAIHLCLGDIGFQFDDEVWIVTTSGGNYVSGCVTKEIEKFCRWSMMKTEKTKAIFVIHEFGFPHSKTKDLKSYNLPIIEDAAYSYGSVFEDGTSVGEIGDYCVFSFSKSFPMSFGGLLKSKKKISYQGVLSENSKEQLAKLVYYYLPSSQRSFEQRKEVYSLYRKILTELGLKERFIPTSSIVPSAFVFKLGDQAYGQKIKTELNRIGIESSVFYGSEGYFLPCHQRMGQAAVEYICWNLSKIMNLKS